MILLTDNLFDDITELYDEEDVMQCSELVFMTTAFFHFLQQESLNTQLVYIETDYFGGYGTQAGVLFKNGSITINPVCEKGIINRLLESIGVLKCGKKMNLILLASEVSEKWNSKKYLKGAEKVLFGFYFLYLQIFVMYGII